MEKHCGPNRDAVDLIAAAPGADWMVIPSLSRNSSRTGATWAIAGDISQYLDESSAFRDFVREANRGEHVRFVSSRDEFAAAILARGAAPPSCPSEQL